MKTAHTGPRPKDRSTRRSWRGWMMMLSDLVAAVGSVWAVVGGWYDTHSVAECVLRVVFVYIYVHVLASMARGGQQ